VWTSVDLDKTASVDLRELACCPSIKWGLDSSWTPRARNLAAAPITFRSAAGVQILTSLDSKWTPRDLFHDVEARKHFRKSMFCWALFWWTWTGSNRRPLPCHLRNINHLQAGTPETQDLAKRGVEAGGRHGAAFCGLDSARTPGLHTGLALGDAPARARLQADVIVVCWSRQQFIPL
jgi:hypothetical protein